MPAVELAPSILSSDFSRIHVAVKEMIDGGADRIHFDVMDGQFVPPITFGSQLVADLRSLGRTPARSLNTLSDEGSTSQGPILFEAHLMTQTPERHFDAFIGAGCQSIIFHTEATAHAHRLAQSLRERGIKPGIAINPGTSESEVEALLDVVDLVLVMTVNPGWGGQAFIRSALEKVARIRAWRPEIDIEVDGGIDPKTIVEARAAGANVFVTGSYVSKAPSLSGALAELRTACG